MATDSESRPLRPWRETIEANRELWGPAIRSTMAKLAASQEYRDAAAEFQRSKSRLRDLGMPVPGDPGVAVGWDDLCYWAGALPGDIETLNALIRCVVNRILDWKAVLSAAAEQKAQRDVAVLHKGSWDRLWGVSAKTGQRRRRELSDMGEGESIGRQRFRATRRGVELLGLKFPTSEVVTSGQI